MEGGFGRCPPRFWHHCRPAGSTPWCVFRPRLGDQVCLVILWSQTKAPGVAVQTVTLCALYRQQRKNKWQWINHLGQPPTICMLSSYDSLTVIWREDRGGGVECTHCCILTYIFLMAIQFTKYVNLLAKNVGNSAHTCNFDKQLRFSAGVVPG